MGEEAQGLALAVGLAFLPSWLEAQVYLYPVYRCYGRQERVLRHVPHKSHRRFYGYSTGHNEWMLSYKMDTTYLVDNLVVRVNFEKKKKTTLCHWGQGCVWVRGALLKSPQIDVRRVQESVFCDPPGCHCQGDCHILTCRHSVHVLGELDQLKWTQKARKSDEACQRCKDGRTQREEGKGVRVRTERRARATGRGWEGAANGTHVLWSTHQPQWGSPDPRHSPQLRYCPQDSTGTLVSWNSTMRV